MKFWVFRLTFYDVGGTWEREWLDFETGEWDKFQTTPVYSSFICQEAIAQKLMVEGIANRTAYGIVVQ